MCDFGLADLPLTSVTLCPSLPTTPLLDVNTQANTHTSRSQTSQLDRETDSAGLYAASRTR